MLTCHNHLPRIPDSEDHFTISRIDEFTATISRNETNNQKSLIYRIGFFNNDELLFIDTNLNQIKIFRFSLLSKKFVGSYYFPRNSNNHQFNSSSLKIVSNPNKPNNPWLFSSSSLCYHQDDDKGSSKETNRLYYCDLVSGDVKYFEASYPIYNFVIDEKRTCIYYINNIIHRENLTTHSINNKFSLRSLNYTTGEEKELYTVDGITAIITDFDPDHDKILCRHVYKYWSYILSIDRVSITEDHPLKRSENLKFYRGGISSSCRKKSDEYLMKFCDGREMVKIISSDRGKDFYFNWYTGHIILVDRDKITIHEPNNIVPTSPVWTVNTHYLHTIKFRSVIEIFTMIRSLCFEKSISLLPNEILFLIFGYL